MIHEEGIGGDESGICYDNEASSHSSCVCISAGRVYDPDLSWPR